MSNSHGIKLPRIQVNRIPDAPDIAVVGGGRWAKIISTLLNEILPPCSHIYLCSPSQAKHLIQWVHSLPFAGNRFRVYESIDSLRKRPNLSAAIIANQSKDHARTGQLLLEFDFHVFIEKPSALNQIEAETLYQLARRKKLLLASGHVFQFAQFMLNFADRVNSEGTLSSLSFEWSDPQNEIRHGHKKTFDPSTPIVVDILPHIYSICRLFVNVGPMELCDVTLNNRCSDVTVALRAGQVEITAHLTRMADKRLRSIKAMLHESEMSLNFTTEPGTIKFGNQSVTADSGYSKENSPLRTQLFQFITAVCGEPPQHPAYSEDIIECGRLIERADHIYKEKKRGWLEYNTKNSKGDRVAEDILYALNEIND